MRYVLMFLMLLFMAVSIVFAPQGLFTPPRFGEETIGPWWYLCTPMDPGQPGRGQLPEDFRTQLDKLALEHGPEAFLYLHDPLTTPEDSLHGYAGVLLPDTTGIAKACAAGMTVALIDSVHAVGAKFPYRGDISLRIGAWKSAEKLRKRARREGLQGEEMWEVRDPNTEQISYWVPERKGKLGN